MVEIKTLIDAKRVGYIGLFRLEELYDIMKTFYRRRGYFYIETRNQEEHFPEGKQIVITMEPERTLSDYVKSRMRIDMVIKGLKDKEVTIDGHKQKYQQGNVQITFFAYLRTDYRNKWQDTGLLFLLRTISDKFIRRDTMHQAEDLIMSDCLALQEEIKAYLNMSRFTVQHESRHDIKADKVA